MVAMSNYTVTAERSGRWWVLQALEAPGAISQVARLEQADQIREAIAFVTGEPEDAISISLVPTLPGQSEEILANYRATRERYEEVRAALAATQAELARLLVDVQHLSVRDAGTIMGVSHQRVHQLVN